MKMETVNAPTSAIRRVNWTGRLEEVAADHPGEWIKFTGDEVNPSTIRTLASKVNAGTHPGAKLIEVEHEGKFELTTSGSALFVRFTRN